MRINFVGGPWDGVEFDSPFYPDMVSLSDLDPEYAPGEKSGTEVMQMRITEQHQYRADRTESQNDGKAASEWSMRERDDAAAVPENDTDHQIIATIYRYVQKENRPGE